MDSTGAKVLGAIGASVQPDGEKAGGAAEEPRRRASTHSGGQKARGCRRKRGEGALEYNRKHKKEFLGVRGGSHGTN